MIMESLDEYLETVADHVFDNDKLVTYKWLSKELKVHVNVAKQILWEFYQQHRKNSGIECTYLLMGLLKDNGMRVEVVKESALSEAKEKYSKLISEHLYSVHKPLENLELLAGSGDVNYSAIKCDACKERSDDEMYLLRWGTAATNIIVENNVKSTDTVNSAKKSGINILFSLSGKKTKKSEELKTSIRDEESMNADKSLDGGENIIQKNKDARERDNVPAGENVEIIEEKENSKDKNSQKHTNLFKSKGFKENNKVSKVISTKKVSPKNGKKEELGNFFKKLTSSPEESVSSEEKNGKVTEEAEKRKEEQKAKENVKAKEELDKNKKDKEKNSRGKKRNRSEKETDNVTKKRKRIIVQSDSSDSEERSDVEMGEVSPEEPEIPARPKSPSLPSVKHENGKRKVLKLVNKTYKEGDYIVTKKERGYVSCSEDEEDKKEEEKRRQAKKVESKEKVKRKQAVLTDFFKKS